MASLQRLPAGNSVPGEGLARAFIPGSEAMKVLPEGPKRDAQHLRSEISKVGVVIVVPQAHDDLPAIGAGG